jgi:regulatory protein
MFEERKRKKLTPHQAFVKLQTWCAYRERSHHEVRNKLYEYGLYTKEIDEIVVKLIEHNFLNEERYALAFVSGKFRIKSWGKSRIVRELKAQKISDYLIRKAMKQIEDVDYEKTLNTLAQKKWNTLKEKNSLKKMSKVLRFLVSKGYSMEESREAVKSLAGGF